MKPIPSTFLFSLCFMLSISSCNTIEKNTAHQNIDPFNLNFEVIDNNEPVEWFLVSDGLACSAKLDNSKSHSGEFSLHLSCKTKEKNKKVGGINSCLVDIAEDSINIAAFVNIVTLSPQSELSFFYQFNSAAEEGAVISIPIVSRKRPNVWEQYDFTLPIEKGKAIQVLNFGFWLKGQGQVWIDNLQLLIDGSSYEEVLKRKINRLSNEQQAILNEKLFPLKHIDIVPNVEDLQPLKSIVKDAKIVMLGEQTHGSNEFVSMKQRIISFLASTMDFDIIAIEANMPEVQLLNEYILSNQKITKEELSILKFYMYQSDEFLAFIQWIQSYNQQSAKKIMLTGFDMQYWAQALNNLISFAKEDSSLSLLLDSLKNILPKRINSEEMGLEHLTLATDIANYIKDKKNSPLMKISKKDYNWLMQNSNILLQSISCEMSGWDSNCRDQKMAENIEWALSQNPASKIIVWAHNGHIKKTEHLMGNWLADEYGNKVVSIGFATNSGTYAAKNFSNHKLGLGHLKIAKYDSWAYYFHQTEVPIFMIDLREISHYFSKKDDKRFRSLGAAITPKQFYPSFLFDEFDAIIYIDKVTSIAVSH